MRRLALVALLWAAPAFGQVAVRSASGPIVGTSFKCALSALAASLTECAAVRSGQRYYITDLAVQTTTATSGQYAIRTGTGTNCGTGTAQLFPASGTGSDRFNAPIASNAMGVFNFTVPLVAPVGAALCVIGTATNTINIQISGYYGP